MPNTVRFHRVLRAAPEKSTGRSLMPTRWPSGCRRTASPARFTRWTPKSAAATRCRSRTSHGQSHSFGGKYLELVPNERIRYTDKFDDPNLPGEMQVDDHLEEGVRAARSSTSCRKAFPT